MLGLAAALLSPTSAFGADAPFLIDAQETHLTLELAAIPPAFGSTLTAKLDGQVLVQTNVALDFDLPLQLGTIFADPAVRAAVGNITIGFHAVGDRAPSPRGPLALIWGASLTLPTVYGPSATSTDLLSVANSFQGLDDLYEFLPAFGFGRLHLGLEMGHSTWLRFRWEAGLAVGVLLRASVRGAPVSWNVDSHAELEARIPLGIRLGLRIQGAESVSVQESAVGLGPYIAYEAPGRRLFVRSGVLYAWILPSFTPSPFGGAPMPFSTVTVLTQVGVRL